MVAAKDTPSGKILYTVKGRAARLRAAEHPTSSMMKYLATIENGTREDHVNIEGSKAAIRSHIPRTIVTSGNPTQRPRSIAIFIRHLILIIYVRW